MKKLLIIFGVVFSLLICSVVSAEDIAARIEIIPAVSDGEVSVSIKYTDNAVMCGGSFNFVYNNSKLEIIDINEEDAIKDTTHFINKNFEANAIRVNWISATTMSTIGDLLTIKFKLLNGSFAKEDISVDSLKIANENGEKLVGEYEVIYQESDSNPSDDITTDNNSSNRKPSKVVNSNEKEGKADVSVNNNLIFDDVQQNDWFFESVKYVAQNKLMNGVAEDRFAPDDTLTRAMLVTVLYRNVGEPTVNKSIPFADIDLGTWYANAVVWAKQNGIVNGVNETDFAPDNNITREQIAAIMFRYAQYKGYDVSVGENTNILSYDDFDSISEYAIASMQYAVGSGLMKGKTASTLNPKDNATRAEIAAILHRFIEANN